MDFVRADAARSQLSLTQSAREARTGFRRHQHVAIIDFHFESVGRQCWQLDQSAADDVVTPTAFAATDMRTGHGAQCQRRSAANAKVTKRVDLTIQVEKRDLNSVDSNYGRFPVVRPTLRPHLDEIGLGHERHHGAISLFNCSESQNCQARCTKSRTLRSSKLCGAYQVPFTSQRPMRRSYACEKRLERPGSFCVGPLVSN